MFRNQLSPEIVDLAKSKLDRYRSCKYIDLVDFVKTSARDSCHVELIDACDNDNKYQIIIDATWDDKVWEGVCIDVSVIPVPVKPLFGFIPISVTSSLDGFIMKPDNSFEDEP